MQEIISNVIGAVDLIGLVLLIVGIAAIFFPTKVLAINTSANLKGSEAQTDATANENRKGIINLRVMGIICILGVFIGLFIRVIW